MSGPVRRCALYTRKSSEEGLDQDYNSLHAQRDACEAYVRSQVSEGWRALPAAYDDGGISGGTMERPALQRLLDDVRAGRVDVVVVYKVDRLTRSLSDFARMVEVFDKHGVSFVSVTQAFNTTTSMGRLTLNVLLSFAQFEREVTGERIRDKIAQSKARGMWMGGNVLLGYDAHERTLRPNPVEAKTVQAIFSRYLELKSVHVLRTELEATGIRSKSGRVIDRGALFHLLSNRHYTGLIVHKGTAHPGLHPAIVEPELFDAVQRQLAVNRSERTRAKVKRETRRPLTGILFDAQGNPMTPSATLKRGGRSYAYYVSSPLLTGTPAGSDPTLRRLPAQATEDYLLGVVGRLSGAPEDTTWTTLKGAVSRVQLGTSEGVLTLGSDALANPHDRQGSLQTISARLIADERAWWEGDEIRVAAPLKVILRGGRTWVAQTPGGVRTPAKTRPDRALIAGLRKAHQLAAARGITPFETSRRGEEIPLRMSTYDRRLCALAFLSPDLQAAILEGRQTPGLSLTDLMANECPPLWDEQRERLSSGWGATRGVRYRKSARAVAHEPEAFEETLLNDAGSPPLLVAR